MSTVGTYFMYVRIMHVHCRDLLYVCPKTISMNLKFQIIRPDGKTSNLKPQISNYPSLLAVHFKRDGAHILAVLAHLIANHGLAVQVLHIFRVLEISVAVPSANHVDIPCAGDEVLIPDLSVGRGTAQFRRVPAKMGYRDDEVSFLLVFQMVGHLIRTFTRVEIGDAAVVLLKHQTL